MSSTLKPESTAVATRAPGKTLDLDSAKTEQRFVEAFAKGQLDKLSAPEQSMFLLALGAKVGLRAELGELPPHLRQATCEGREVELNSGEKVHVRTSPTIAPSGLPLL